MTKFHLEWEAPPSGFFRTGVSLHSHTLYSRESLGFIYQAAEKAPILKRALDRGDQRFRARHHEPMNLAQGWWTPPLGPHAAWQLEASQLQKLELKALVSLTDHDNIEAPVSLQLIADSAGAPISVEWTVPFGPTFFHLGVHNLPPAEARWLFDAMAADTKTGGKSATELLAELSARPELLLVFNHPMWDEKGIGKEVHRAAVDEFLRRNGQFLHAFELNGLRPWAENHRAVRLASEYSRPVVSGGDRHAIEPNAVVNLTNQSTFAEFVEEVRGGFSQVLIMRHYRESHGSRIFHNMMDVLRTYDQHVHGWRLWSDRVFYQMSSGHVQSLTEWFDKKTPLPVSLFVGALEFASQPKVRRWLKSGFLGREEVVL
jgi:hypothetical protein